MSKIYFSGINGVGISPLAELAQDMGVEVCGSDMRRGELAPELEKRGLEVYLGDALNNNPLGNDCCNLMIINPPFNKHTDIPKDYKEIISSKSS